MINSFPEAHCAIIPYLPPPPQALAFAVYSLNGTKVFMKGNFHDVNNLET